MIPERIKLMFQFAEFLHSNIDNFAQYDGVFAETRELNSQRWRLNEHGSYAERRQYENFTAQISVNLDTIEEAVLSKIRQKATELGVFDPNSPATVWNWNYPEIVKVKEEADDNDLGEILSATGKYLAFREAGKYTDYLCMGFIFGDLDKLMIGELHNYFSEEKTAPPTVHVVNSLGDAINAFKEGQTFVTIPFSAPIVERTDTPASQKDIESKPMTDDHAPIPPTPWMYVGEGQIQPSLPAIKDIEDELRNRSTVREKLDYWVEAISKRVEEVSGMQHDLDFPTLTEEGERSILKNVFGGTARLVSPVKIPDYIHLEHFSDWRSNAEYTNWFIPFKSKWWFQKLIKDNKADEHISSPLGTDFIRGQLKPITDIENKASELLANGQINIDADYKEQSLIDMVEYLRIKGGYYQRHAAPGIFTISGTNPPLQAYARHVYYKEYLNQPLVEKEVLRLPVPAKLSPGLSARRILFNSDETIQKLHSELKGYFPDKEQELLNVLNGREIAELLVFPHNQNKFVEVFRRLKYNNLLTSSGTQIKNWIRSTFLRTKKGITEPRPFNENSIEDILNKGKGEPSKKERICTTDWLPYKSPLQLKREAEAEKI